MKVLSQFLKAEMASRLAGEDGEALKKSERAIVKAKLRLKIKVYEQGE